MIVFCYGYSSFAPWSVDDFFIYYTMVILGKLYGCFDLLRQLSDNLAAPVTFGVWKIVKRTKLVKPLEADLIWERPTIDAYEETFIDEPLSFWTEMLGPLNRFKKQSKGDRQVSIVA